MPALRVALLRGWGRTAAGSIVVVFATLLGSLPRPTLPDDAAPEAVLETVLEAQSAAGLEPLIDGGWAPPGLGPLAAWQVARARTTSLVKAVIVGPYSSDTPAATVRATVMALADAGCAWIEVHEPAAVSIGIDPIGRARFADAQRALTTDLAGHPGLHLSLAVTGGSADAAGIETVLAGAYASLAVDLIEGPDNWRLVAATPGDRGIVCGALGTSDDSDDSPELLLYAAGYAASTAGRGPARVGLATAGSLQALRWDVAVRKLERLGAAARLADASADERRATLDPRSVDIRSAALGIGKPPGGARPARRGLGPEA